MAIKELILHGVTSIEAKLPSTNDTFNNRRIRFEMDDGTNFTVIAFADHRENLRFNIDYPSAFKGEK